MPKIVVSDSKGLVQETGKGVVGLVQSKTVSASWVDGAVIESGAIKIPANSLITGMHSVVTTSLNGAAGVVNVKAGTAAAGNQLAVAANLGADLAGAAAGKGQSTNTELNTALAGAEVLVLTAGTTYRSADTDVHITATDASGNLTAGAIQFTVEFITFS
jgi:hypothetical protein